MVKIKGMLKDRPIFTLIGLGEILSYVSPKTVEVYILQQHKFEKYWLFQLARGTKLKVTNFLKKRDFIMNGLKTHLDLLI